MNYELKDKLNATAEFLSELEMKSWQEIEHLQAQIANLADSPVNSKLRQLFKNLLTSYYVFAGGIEALASDNELSNKAHIEIQAEPIQAVTVTDPIIDSEQPVVDNTIEFNVDAQNELDTIEPFEYFVDFDEPVGDPITDKDLYNN